LILADTDIRIEYQWNIVLVGSCKLGVSYEHRVTPVGGQ